ncbi:MAG: hypothetical protein ACO2PN_06425 [Pyrobaculum sp.]|jgi:hypothetical protein
MDFDLRSLLRRVAEEVEAEIKQVEKELVEVEWRARRGGAEARAEQLSAIKNILYEDKRFRIATAVYAHLKRQFAEDAKAGEIIEAAERRLFGLRLEVVEAPLLKIEAAVDQEGKVVAVRYRAALDLGVEAVYVGAAPGYRLEKTAQAGKTAGAGAAGGVRRRGGGGKAAEKTATGAEAALDVRKGAAGRSVVSAGNRRRGEEEGWVERILEEVRREFSGLPVYVGVEDGHVYVKRTAPMDQRRFKKYTEVCRRLGFRFDRREERWIKPLEELKTT